MSAKKRAGSPEKEEDGVEEGAEVVVAVDIRRRLKLDASKHLQRSIRGRKTSASELMTSVTHLHADDGVDEEEHSDQQHDVR